MSQHGSTKQQCHYNKQDLETRPRTSQEWNFQHHARCQFISPPKDLYCLPPLYLYTYTYTYTVCLYLYLPRFSPFYHRHSTQAAAPPWRGSAFREALRKAMAPQRGAGERAERSGAERRRGRRGGRGRYVLDMFRSTDGWSGGVEGQCFLSQKSRWVKKCFLNQKEVSLEF